MYAAENEVEAQELCCPQVIVVPSSLTQVYAARERDSGGAPAGGVPGGGAGGQGDAVALPVVSLDVCVEVNVTVASVLLRITYQNTVTTAGAEGGVDCVFQAPMMEGKGTVIGCDVLAGSRSFSTSVIDADAADFHVSGELQGVANAFSEVPGLQMDSSAFDPRYFRMPFTGVMPGEKIVVELQYLQDLEFNNGSYGIVVPTYIPEGNALPPGGPSSTPIPLAQVMADQAAGARVTINCTMNTGTPECRWDNTSHKLRVLYQNPSRVVLVGDAEEQPNCNFAISYFAWSHQIVASCIVDAPTREDPVGAFTMFVSPPEQLGATDVFGRNVVFLLDHSGSMAGSAMSKACEATVAGLEQLKPHDQFAIGAFDHEQLYFTGSAGEASPVMPNGLFPATPQNIQAAQAWVRGIQARAMTDILAPLQAAVQLLNAAFTQESTQYVPRSPIVFLVTDGAVWNERDICRYAKASLGPVRMFTFGIGPYTNRFFLKMLAQVGRGYSDVSLYPHKLVAQMTSLMAKTHAPVLRDISVGITGVRDVEIYPFPIPDLYQGAPLVVAARYQGQITQAMQIQGTLPNGQRIDIPVTPYNAEMVPVKKVFARQQLDNLIATWWLLEGAEAAAVRQRIVDIAVQNSMPCAFTQTIGYQTEESVVQAESQYGPDGLLDLRTPEQREEGQRREQGKASTGKANSTMARNRRAWGTGLAVGGAIALGAAVAATYAFGSVTATANNLSVTDAMAGLDLGGFGADFASLAGDAFGALGDVCDCHFCPQELLTGLDDVCCFDLGSACGDAQDWCSTFCSAHEGILDTFFGQCGECCGNFGVNCSGMCGDCGSNIGQCVSGCSGTVSNCCSGVAGGDLVGSTTQCFGSTCEGAMQCIGGGGQALAAGLSGICEAGGTCCTDCCANYSGVFDLCSDFTACGNGCASVFGGCGDLLGGFASGLGECCVLGADCFGDVFGAVGDIAGIFL